MPHDWLDAFEMLISYLDSLTQVDRKVVFLDELPWMDTVGSDFINSDCFDSYMRASVSCSLFLPIILFFISLFSCFNFLSLTKIARKSNYWLYLTLV